MKVESDHDDERGRDGRNQHHRQVTLDLLVEPAPIALRHEARKARVDHRCERRRADRENRQDQLVPIAEDGEAALSKRGSHGLIDDADPAEDDAVREVGHELAESHPGLVEATVPGGQDVKVMPVKADDQENDLGQTADYEANGGRDDSALGVDPECADGCDGDQHRRHRGEAKAVAGIEHGRPDGRHGEEEDGRQHDHPELTSLGQLGIAEIGRDDREERIPKRDQGQGNHSQAGEADQEHLAEKSAGMSLAAAAVRFGLERDDHAGECVADDQGQKLGYRPRGNEGVGGVRRPEFGGEDNVAQHASDLDAD